MKILYIGDQIDKPKSGGDQVNLRNCQFLEKIQGSDIDYVEINKGYLESRLFKGVTLDVLKNINKLLQTGLYTHVFISQSYLGRAAYYIKRKFPNVIILVFYHNVEVHFAREAYKVQGAKAILSILTSYLWESLATKYGDKLISLNNRDNKLLQDIYKRSSDLVLPTSLQDSFDESRAVEKTDCDEIIYLFVGVAFFANIEGVKWFIHNVLPNIPGTLYIVGKGMDLIDFGDSSKIKVFGYVDDLSSYYYNANFVIAPILSGGGMKTKTAEALMYGKTIIGTAEAFEGYEFCDFCMYITNTITEFIDQINYLVNNGSTDYYNKSARQLFLNNYSYAKTYESLNKIL